MTASDPARADRNVVVVGAGAAGIAAARHLTARGFAVTVLDARDRVGGRAWTALLDGRHPADLGCGWLHSADRNPWTGIALRLGLEVDRKLPDWGFRLAKARQLGAIEADARERSFAAFWRAIEEPVGPDRALADALPASDSWLPSFAAVTSSISSAGPAALSVADLACYADSGLNWQVVEGYGRLVERYAGLPVKLAAPAEAVDWSAAPWR
ncbi:MAG TPA: FAD-dependent oxidoreductase [Geminicoccaceae bacterium]|nr:FAD-dependent oxidoreductase [Geminicoccaceae bacterium]